MALFTRGLGWDATDVEVFLVDVRKSMRDKNVHAWWPMCVSPHLRWYRPD
jgi:hypothetical protein